MHTLRIFASRCPRQVSLRTARCFATAVDPLNGRSEKLSSTGNRVRIVEVGPRDGLQNEKNPIPLSMKIDLIERLAKTGLTDIEAGSFVAPKWTPQMANSDEILDHILRHPPSSPHPINYSFLAPNIKGFSNAIKVIKNDAPISQNGARSKPHHQPLSESLSTITNAPKLEFSVFAAATESFTQKNLNCDIATSLERFKPVIQGAKAEGFRVRAYISVVLGCPFEGEDVDPQKVAEIATDLMEMGADEIDLGDTTGMGTMTKTDALLKAMTAAGVRNEDIAMHFHDTYGQALANTFVSLQHGIRIFDSSVGGLGGCPYSPGATGNVATEDMVYFIESLGMETGVDVDALADIGGWITGEIGKPNGSAVGKALLGKRARMQAHL